MSVWVSFGDFAEDVDCTIPIRRCLPIEIKSV